MGLWLRPLLVFVLAISAFGQPQSQTGAPGIDAEHTRWVGEALKAVQKIKIGMTRAELMKMFTTEGGLSTARQRTYVFRECPYIKVDVTFAPSTNEELPGDKIVEISRPYLAWPVMD